MMHCLFVQLFCWQTNSTHSNSKNKYCNWDVLEHELPKWWMLFFSFDCWMAPWQSLKCLNFPWQMRYVHRFHWSENDIDSLGEKHRTQDTDRRPFPISTVPPFCFLVSICVDIIYQAWAWSSVHPEKTQRWIPPPLKRNRKHESQNYWFCGQNAQIPCLHGHVCSTKPSGVELSQVLLGAGRSFVLCVGKRGSMLEQMSWNV